MNDTNDVFDIPTIPEELNKPVVDVPSDSSNLDNSVSSEPIPANTEVVENATPREVTPETSEVVSNDNVTPDIDIESLDDNPLDSFETTSMEMTSDLKEAVSKATNETSEEIAPFAKPNQDVSEPVSLGSISKLPDSLDQNFGVIEDKTNSDEKPTEVKNNTPAEPKNKEKKPKKEKKPRAPKEKKEKKPVKVGLIILIAFVVLLGIFGFMGYKFFFSLNPVKEMTDILRTYGNEVDDFIKKDANYQLLKNNSGFDYSGTITENIDGENSLYKVEGYIDSSSNKLNIKVSDKDYNVEGTLLNNAAFLKIKESGYHYRLTSSNELDINGLVANLDLKKSFNNAANIIDNNISKNDFSSRVMRIKPNNKVILVNKYSLKISGKKIKDIIKEIIDKEEEPNTKILLSMIDYKSLSDKEMNMDVYLSLKKIEKIDISYAGHSAVIVFIDDNNIMIRMDSDVYNIQKTNNGYNISINDKDSIEVTYESSLEKDVVNTKYTYTSIIGDETREYVYESKLATNKDVYVPIPFNIVDYDSEKGKINYENELKEFEKGKSFLNKIMELKK